MQKISVITINYNNLKGLEKTFQSVFKQTDKDFEYIVIDGASTDGSVKLIEENAGKLAYWISETDNGIYNAMNKGWLKATGDFCLFLNSGDYLYDNDVLKNVKYILDKKTDIFIGKNVWENVDGHSSSAFFHTDFSLYTLSHSSFPHQASFISKNLLISLGGYDETFKCISDWLFYFRSIIEKDANFSFIDRNIAYFEDGGISSKTDINLEKKEAIMLYHPFFLKEIKYYHDLRFYRLNRLIRLVKKLIQKIKK